MELTLAEQLLLLALDDDKGHLTVDDTRLHYALSAALLLSLALAGRLNLVSKKIRVVSDAPVGDIHQNQLLQKITGEKQVKPLKSWLQLYSDHHDIRKDVTEGLVEKGVLTRTEKKVLWVFRIIRYPTQNIAPEKNLRQHLNAVINREATPTPGDIMLLSLIQVAGLRKEVFGKEKQVEEEVTALVERERLAREAGDAVKVIMDEMAALLPTVVATTVISPN